MSPRGPPCRPDARHRALLCTIPPTHHTNRGGPMVVVKDVHVRLVAMAITATLLAGTAVAVVSSGAASATESPYKIAMVTSLTGPGASEFSQAAAGFDARIDLQNAEGGVDGHKLEGIVLDDQTSPSEVVTAVQNAISKGVIGIVSDSPLFFEAAKYPNEQGVPVTGGFFDGPEWGEQPYTNMFAADVGSVDPKYPVSTGIGTFMRSHGGTVICSYGYGISPSSARSAYGTVLSFTHDGGKEGVLDTSVPFGSVDMTTAALVAKQKGCNAFYAGLDDNSNYALATDLGQDGVKAKVLVFPTGYEPSVIHSTAWAAVQGAYFDTTFRPFQLPDAADRQDEVGPAEIRPLHLQRVPELQPVRVVARRRSHDQGNPAGGEGRYPGRRDQGAPQPQGLQRRRPATGQHQLLDHLRPRSGGAVRVVPAGRQERLRPGLEPADLRQGPARDHDGAAVGGMLLRRVSAPARSGAPVSR